MGVDRDLLRRRLRAVFVDELDEHVVVLNRGLLALEGGTQPVRGAPVDELFRAAHSLKGAARSADVRAVETLCHRLEDALAGLRDGTLAADGRTLEALFAAVDAVAAAGRGLREGRDPTPGDLLPAVDALTALVDGDGDHVAAERRAASAHPAATGAVRPGPPTGGGDTAGAAGGHDEARARPEATVVRVASSRLDALLDHTGELVAARRLVEALAADLGAAAVRLAGGTAATPADGGAGPGALLDRLARTATATDRALRHAADAMADAAREARMLAFGQVCEGLERAVRDVAKAAGKEARLAVEGADVELDRPIVVALRDPVLHLVRNAVDHGIEEPAARAAAGKPGTGVVRVAAALRGATVEVTVADDGAGVDVAALRAAAGPRADAVGDQSPESLLELAFTPGLSTSPAVTEVSGRGVGLDAVRAAVEGLGGSVRLASAPGAGTEAVLSLPITLSAVRVLLVRAGAEVVALLASGVSRILRLDPSDIHPLDQGEVVRVGDRAVPVLALADALGLDGDAGDEDETGARTAVEVVLVGGNGEAEGAFVVDELVGEQELVMKPLGPRLSGLPAALGASVLATGQVALVLNPVALVRVGRGRRRPRPAAAPVAEGPRRRILLVEDTITTRALERSILEAAGYDVLVAVDGVDGWQLLQEHGADLVVSDVQMPRMDGFALCEAIRASPRFRDVPVMLVTSLASEADRRRGVAAGANAYVVKSAFEQPVLLDTIERLL